MTFLVFINALVNISIASLDISVNGLNALPYDLNTVSKEDQNLLIRPKTLDEVFLTNKPRPRGKNVGHNGLNIESYLFYWEVIKNPILSKDITFSQLYPYPNHRVKPMRYLFLKTTIPIK